MENNGQNATNEYHSLVTSGSRITESLEYWKVKMQDPAFATSDWGNVVLGAVSMQSIINQWLTIAHQEDDLDYARDIFFGLARLCAKLDRDGDLRETLNTILGDNISD